MIYTIVSVRDAALGAYGRPFFTMSIGQAIRSFQDEINRAAEDNNMNKHPKDFDLYSLGTFDDQSGQFTQLPHPELLLQGSQSITKV
uniref:phage ORF5 protein n=1 Tax=Mariniflexile sp. TaxID=1979402 RepID=UPI004047C348